MRATALSVEPGGRVAQSTEAIVRLLLFVAVSTFAALTVVTHVAQLLELRFSTYTILVVITLIAAAAGALGWSLKRWVPVRVASLNASLLLLVLAVGCAYIAVAQYRPSGDDRLYLPNAVYHLEHPNEPLDLQVHFLYSGGEVFKSISWATSLPFEYSQAALSTVLPLHLLDLYFVIVPALTGFLLPLALFYLVAQFTDDPLDAVVGVWIGLGVLLLLGETPRTPLNFSLTRLFEGKVFAVSVGIPLFAAQSIHFFRVRAAALYEWVFLFAIATFMAGSTSSTVVLLPALWVLLTLALFATTPRDVFRRRVIAYAGTLIYVGLYGLVLYVFRDQTPGYFSVANDFFSTTFIGQVDLLVNSSAPLTPIMAVVGGVAAVILTRATRRRFLLVWIVGALVLFLNPVAAAVLIRYVTTQNLYWRLFYLIPIPFLIAVAAAQGLAYLRTISTPAAVAGVVSALLVLVAANVLTPFSMFRQLGYWPWALPDVTTHRIDRWKLVFPAYQVDQMQAVIAAAPAGVMLAPLPTAAIIPVLTSRDPQLRVGNDGVRFWLEQQGRVDEAELRIRASDFLELGTKADFPALQSIVAQYQHELASIVCNASVCNDVDVQSVLNDYGFQRSAQVGTYDIYVPGGALASLGTG